MYNNTETDVPLYLAFNDIPTSFNPALLDDEGKEKTLTLHKPSIFVEENHRSPFTSRRFLDEYISALRGEGTDKKDNRTGAKSVLILTYMRSGSSLTGDIMQQVTEAFYLFEPFHYIRRPDPLKTIIKYVNGSTSSIPLDVTKEKNCGIYNWFTCNLQNVAVRSTLDNFMRLGKKSQRMLSCLYENHDLPASDRNRLCVDELQASCLASPVRIIKTIRTELEHAGQLLDILPNMKIIHLVRDPRATLFSQRSLGMCTIELGGQEGCTQKYCKLLENNVLAEERLKEKHPERVKTFFYEDIATNPIETSRKMYEFIGEPFTGSARDYIFNITSAGNKDTCAICTMRANSSEHIHTWKTKMTKSFINIVQDRCNYVLKRYKYEIV